MGKIGLVTDSTADLPLSYYSENDVLMVPLEVRFGEDCYKDWTEINPQQFYKRLSLETDLPKTSQPSVADFLNAYKTLSEECEHIISVHLSSELSGTIKSAEMAKDESPGEVAIVDTKLASLGTGLVLDALVEARKQNKEASELVEIAHQVSSQIRCLFTVDTLKYLEKGGRIGKASVLVGSLLNIKPILTLEDGGVVPYKKVKGKKRIFSEMVEAIAQYAEGKDELKVGFAHAGNPDAIAILKEEVEKRGVKLSSSIESEVGTVIGTYTGPKAFAVMFH